jgi:hypothetical protein
VLQVDEFRGFEIWGSWVSCGVEISGRETDMR